MHVWKDKEGCMQVYAKQGKPSKPLKMKMVEILNIPLTLHRITMLVKRVIIRKLLRFLLKGGLKVG